MSADLNHVHAEMKAAGFTLARRKKHHVWKDAGGRTIVTSATPSDVRSFDNMLTQLRRTTATPAFTPQTDTDDSLFDSIVTKRPTKSGSGPAQIAGTGYKYVDPKNRNHVTADALIASYNASQFQKNKEFAAQQTNQVRFYFRDFVKQYANVSAQQWREESLETIKSMDGTDGFTEEDFESVLSKSNRMAYEVVAAYALEISKRMRWEYERDTDSFRFSMFNFKIRNQAALSKSLPLADGDESGELRFYTLNAYKDWAKRFKETILNGENNYFVLKLKVAGA